MMSLQRLLHWISAITARHDQMFDYSIYYCPCFGYSSECKGKAVLLAEKCSQEINFPHSPLPLLAVCCSAVTEYAQNPTSGALQFLSTYTVVSKSRSPIPR
jgi:hypothetical protein